MYPSTVKLSNAPVTDSTISPKKRTPKHTFSNYGIAVPRHGAANFGQLVHDPQVTGVPASNKR